MPGCTETRQRLALGFKGFANLAIVQTALAEIPRACSYIAPFQPAPALPQRAHAGIMMRGVPQENTPSYLQGFAPLVEFRDRAQVSKMGQTTPGLPAAASHS